MKKIVLILLVLVALKRISYGQANDIIPSEECEYMTIISEFPGKKVFLVYITQPDGNYEKLKFSSFYRSKYGQTTVLLDLLDKYSKQGWAIENSDMDVENGDYYFYYLLKRKIYDVITTKNSIEF